MDPYDYKTIGIILCVIGIEGIIAGNLKLHLVLNPIINIILIIIGLLLIFKLGKENNNE